jgi:peptide/nickel transport system ATP-binding protein
MPVTLMTSSGEEHLRPGEVLLKATHLVVEYPAAGGGRVHAVSDVSIDLVEGETLGLVGESGCGKSTLGRAILQLPRPDAGSVLFDGTDMTRMRGKQLRRMRQRVQIIFQDPISSLNPRHRISDIVADPLKMWRAGTAAQIAEKVRQVLQDVGLDPDQVGRRRPFELSGGQCQRVCIARALIQEPKVLVCDEPVSALDVSVQAQVLNLLEDMKLRYGLTLLFIAHDLAVVKSISDRVAVMYLGKLCEVSSADDLYRRPAHPYTRALLDAIPVPDPAHRASAEGAIAGELPSPVDPPSGCRFRTRCPRADETCAVQAPPMRELADGHHVACHHPLWGPARAGKPTQTTSTVAVSQGEGTS